MKNPKLYRLRVFVIIYETGKSVCAISIMLVLMGANLFLMVVDEEEKINKGKLFATSRQNRK